MMVTSFWWCKKRAQWRATCIGCDEEGCSKKVRMAPLFKRTVSNTQGVSESRKRIPKFTRSSKRVKV